MKRLIILTIFLCLTHVANAEDLYKHRGNPFVLAAEEVNSINVLDAGFRRYIRYAQPVRIKGTIKYQCKIKGSWAFVEDKTGLVMVDFSVTSPNILLPLKQHSNPIAVEGILIPDETVLNNYHIEAKSWEFQRN